MEEQNTNKISKSNFNIFIKEFIFLSLTLYVGCYFFVVITIQFFDNKWPKQYLLGYGYDIFWLAPLIGGITIWLYFWLAKKIKKYLKDDTLNIYRAAVYSAVVAVIVFLLMDGSPFL